MQIEDIKDLVQTSDSVTNATREEASTMLFFGRANQWDDFGYDGVQLQYRGQFDIIKPKRNKILAELWQSPPQVEFKARDGANPDTAEILNGKFRNDMIRGEESIETMIQDQVDCGFGAFRFCTEYESRNNDMNDHQRITPKPINEANNVVYMDAGARTKDKSDARWGLIISTFSTDSWKHYCKEIGIDCDENEAPPVFKQPNTSNNWLWGGANTNEIKIGEFYHRERKRERVLKFEDPLGESIIIKQKELKARMDEIEDGGYLRVGEKFTDRWIVTKYIVDGDKVLKKQTIPGEYIPIVCAYGDWSYIEGRELWRGIYWDAQDAQRLHNGLMSYTTDIVMKGPRQKPILPAGMIQGKETYWTDAGPDDNFPYKLINDLNPTTGNPYDASQIGYMQPPAMPAAQAQLMQLVRQSVDDVTGGTIDQDMMMNGQVTEGQIMAAQKSSNMESFLYQNSLSLATKQAGRIWLSMFKDLNDGEQEVTVTKIDGSEDTATLMKSEFNYETGKEEIENDINVGSFEVYVDTGPSYSSVREQAEAELQSMATALQGTPEGQILLLSYMAIKDAPGFKDIRKWANNQLILQGIKEPQSDDEIEMFEQAQQAVQEQGQQPDPNMALANAEQAKADASMAKVQSDAANNTAKNQIDAFNAESKRIDVIASNKLKQVDAAKTASEIKGNELDNIGKLADRFMGLPVQ
jgi:hypothetical protein